MRHQLDRLLVLDVLGAELVLGHLVNTLAELADRVGNDRDAFEHLTCDRIDDVEQLDEHFLVKSLLALSFYIPAPAARSQARSSPLFRTMRVDRRTLIRIALLLLGHSRS